MKWMKPTKYRIDPEGATKTQFFALGLELEMKGYELEKMSRVGLSRIGYLEIVPPSMLRPYPTLRERRWARRSHWSWVRRNFPLAKME